MKKKIIILAMIFGLILTNISSLFQFSKSNSQSQINYSYKYLVIKNPKLSIVISIIWDYFNY